MSDGTVLSEEQLRAVYYDGRNKDLLSALRAVERAVLEAVHPQCTDPIVGEHGHPLCGEVERLRARVAELEADATRASFAGGQIPHNRTEAELRSALGWSAVDRQKLIEEREAALAQASEFAAQVMTLVAERDAALRDVEERSNEIGEVMRVNERLANEISTLRALDRAREGK